MRKNSPERDTLSRKIEKMYQNYGLDTSNMSEDEFDRMKQSYLDDLGDIDSDLRASEQHKERFANDIV